MGGVATFVANELKQHTVRVKEGLENDEYLITRLDHVSPPVNIMNVYGGQETRMTNQEILDNWINMKAEIMEIKNRDEGLILIGDINRSIGRQPRCPGQSRQRVLRGDTDQGDAGGQGGQD